MIHDVEHIGSYAGKVWVNLNEQGTLRKQEIMKNAELKNNEFHLALGWLARENKIYSSEDANTFSLGDTNLDEDIGSKAGRVYDVLANSSKQGVASISKMTKLRPKEVYTALGWLAREDKINIYHPSSTQVKYSLKEQ